MTRGSSKAELEETEKLINKVCTNFVAQMESKIDDKLSKLDNKISSYCDLLKKTDKMVAKNSESIENIQIRVDSLEQNIKSNSLRICGLNIDDKDMVQGVCTFIKDSLKIQCSSDDFDCAFRVKKKNDSEGRNTILVRFFSNIMKNKVMAAKKLLKDTGVVIYEDLTRGKYDLLVAAKKKHGKNVWSAGGRIFRWDASNNRKVAILGNGDI